MYQCSGCDKYFHYRGPHSAHRVGNHQLRQRRCLSTEEMIVLGWTPEKSTAKTGPNAGKTFWRMPAKEGGLPDFSRMGTKDEDAEIEEEDENEQ
jgi:hypothetical protein